MDGLHQAFVAAHGQEVDAEAALPLDVLEGVGVLVQVAHHGEKGGLVPVKAAPRVEAYVGQAVFLPCGDGKERRGDARRRLKVGKQLEFLRIRGPEMFGEGLGDLDFHGRTSSLRG